ncbi:tetratricopeptide repeat protein [Terricaulis sp.]|uniref:tetratricopeptide repeat protein n=1 Tax=Terricaulis sp. TaxID=2768686 RepID=UPI0037834F81
MSIEDTLQSADRCERAGDILGAEKTLRSAIRATPNEARLHFALGELVQRMGYAGHAADSFAEALRLNPGLSNVRRAFARASLDAGRVETAEAAARRLIADTDSSDAWDILASALRAQDRLDEALAAGEEAMKRAPGQNPPKHNRAVTLTRLGRNEEALTTFDALVAARVEAPMLWLNRGVALLNLTRLQEAEDVFADGVKRWPFDLGLQNALANTRWMRGHGEAFTRDYEAAIRKQPEALPLVLGCADLVRRAGFGAKAETMLRDALKLMPEAPPLLSSLGVMLDELDRTAEALPLLERAIARAPQATDIRANYASALMRLGRGDQALKEIQPARIAEPLNQAWICYETMALRQIGDPRYHVLCDYDLMVRPFDLPVPPGYANIEAFNEALIASLNALHVLETHPLDQSLRHGSQTTRSLIYVADPVIQAYLKALDGPIRAYMDLMRDPDHPWSGRKTGNYRLSGSWSVKLKGGGFHINHLHPAGWISSAYYVYLPPAVHEGQQGWIKFGEPRWPTPGCTIEKVIQPRAGRLVLFPSYMWHGTIPFEAGERMTAPFDAVPA